MFVGVDVGGTNTDAVLMEGHRLDGSVKLPTTADVTSGIVDAIAELLKQQSGTGGDNSVGIDAVMVGTTHFTNALLESRDLAPTAVIRLSLPATQLLPPLVDWPADLKAAIGGQPYMVGGGNEFDGREISPLDRQGHPAGRAGDAATGHPRGGSLRSIFAGGPGPRDRGRGHYPRDRPGYAGMPLLRERPNGAAGSARMPRPSTPAWATWPSAPSRV